MQDSRDFHTLVVPLGSRPTWSPRVCAWSLVVAGCVAAIGASAGAQEYGEYPGVDPGPMDGGPPITEYGGGDYFSQDLGTILRARYNTESYGQDRRGNLDIGTMRVANFEDAIVFFDGQVTLNDVSGVGFNTGVGFRWLHWTPFPLEPERITGFSVWADGTNTEPGKFFPQVGLTWESLGDMWDFRANAYIPVGKRSKVGDFVPTGEIDFLGNLLVDVTVADRFTSFNVGELEFAGRLGADRDAWAFAGPYVLASDDDDTAGYRVGVRGYAYPDLLLQLAVSDDDIFKTNATFSVTWFIGRTRTDFQPACGLADRMREPVMRNDYVVLAKDQVTGGVALTDVDGDPFRFVHVDSTAGAGGDGTFENPLNDVGEVEGNSLEDDIILLYANSIFPGQNSLVLQDRQRLLGEGNNMTFQITTQQEGVIDIPETSEGARAGAKPIILNALGDAITLADQNEVANLEIDGGMRGIVAGPDGAGSPNLHDLMIHDTTLDGIMLTPLVRDNDDNPATPQRTVAFNVTIDNVMFDNIGGNDINIDADSGETLPDPNVTLQEAISITNVTSTNGGSRGILLQNTHDGGTFTLTNYTNGTANVAGSGGGDASEGVLRFANLAGDMTLTNVDIMNNIGFAFDFETVAATTSVMISGGSLYDGGAGAAGGMNFTGYNGTLTVSNTTLRNGTQSGVLIDGGSDGTFTFNDNVMFESIDGTAFDVNGFTGVLTVHGNITNDTGRSVSIRNVSQAGTSLTFNGDITDTGFSTGILIQDSSNGTILFTGDLMLDVMNATGIALIDNTGADINFTGLVVVEADGVGQFAFTATGGGTLTVSNTSNLINVPSGATGLRISDMTISNAGVNFSQFDVTGGPRGALLSMNTGGPILLGTVGDAAGDSGVITNVTVTPIEIDNSANVTVSGLRINTAAAQSGVLVNKTTAGVQTVNLNDLEINGGANGINVIGGGAAAGNLNMTVNDTDVNGSTAFGLSFNDVDNGTIQVNNVTLDGNSAGATAVGVRILNSNASFTFDSDTMIQTFLGTAFEISGGTGTLNMQGDVTNTTGRSIHIHDVTGGTKTFAASSAVDDDGLGILVQNNTGGTFNLLGTYDLDPVMAAPEAVLIDNNTGATITIAGLDIMTSAGSTTRGFVAQGGGTVSVTGTTNVIDTEDGSGLVLTGMAIGAVDFQSVTVDGGTAPTNAIVLQSLTGGQVEIGTSTGADGSGGTLNSTGDAIVITNVANVALHDIVVNDSGGHGVAITKSNTASTTVTMDNVDVTTTTNDAVNLNVTSSGQVNLTINESDFASTVGGEAIEIAAGGTANDVNVTVDSLTASDNILATTANNVALDFRLTNSMITGSTTMNLNSSGNFDMLVQDSTLTAAGVTTLDLNFGNNAQDGDVIIRNNTIMAGNAKALEVTSNGTNGDIDFLLDNNIMSNNSAASETADILISGGATFDANVVNNTFANPGGVEYAMESDGATTRINLHIDNNNAGGAGVYNLTTSNNGGGFNFGVQLRDTADARNTGTVNFSPIITDFENLGAGPVEMPMLP